MVNVKKSDVEKALRKYEKITSNEPKGMKKILIDILHIKGKSLTDLKTHGSMKVKNDGYMDLNIDYLGKECGLDKYAVAHNHIQNGDLMKYPDMMFYDSNNEFYATSFEQDGVPQISQISVQCEKNQLMKNPKLQKQHQVFSNQWARNLKEQGFTKVDKDNIIFD